MGASRGSRPLNSVLSEQFRQWPPTEVTRGRSGFGSWEIATRGPHPRLGAFVLGYLGFKSRIELPRERHLPSGEAELLINLGRPYRVMDPSDRSRWSSHRSTAVIGVHDRCVISEETGAQNVLVVRLRPPGAHILFDAPMHELANRFVEFEAVNPGLARSLPSQLYGARDWETRFAIMDSVIARRVERARPAASRAAWAWQSLHDSAGMMSIRSLASESGCSPKHLIAQFRDYVGLPPKIAARVLRFNRALKLIERGGALEWPQIALECGYYDQAHFIRDFRVFAGCTPVELADSMVGPSFRVGDAEAGR